MTSPLKLSLSAILAVLLTSASATAATVYIADGSADQIIVVDTDTGTVERKITGLDAIHGLSGAPGVRYLVAGSYSEVEGTEATALAKPEGVSEDEHAAHHAKPAAGAMPKDAAISILTILSQSLVRYCVGSKCPARSIILLFRPTVVTLQLLIHQVTG